MARPMPKAGPFRSEVLPQGDAPFDDREVSCGDLALDADLVAGVFGHPRGAPSPHSCDVQATSGVASVGAEPASIASAGTL